MRFKKLGSKLRDIILGGQDGLVNVLGVVLVVAGATANTRVILIAGLAATFAESISMGAVAYTSTKAAIDYAKSRKLHKCPTVFTDPVLSAVVVGLSAVVGSFIPLLPFFFLPVMTAVITALVISTIALFITGAIKAEITVGTWWKSGLELAFIGMSAAILGYVIGILLGMLI